MYQSYICTLNNKELAKEINFYKKKYLGLRGYIKYKFGYIGADTINCARTFYNEAINELKIREPTDWQDFLRWF